MSKILVVGSSNTDMVVKTERFPQPGETIIGGEFFMFPGGKGANQAVAAARLGGDVQFLTRIGDDVFGKQSLEGFKAEGIDCTHVIIDQDHSSGVALITVNNHGENEIVVASGANAELSTHDIENVTGSIKDASIILTQLENPIKSISYLIQKASGLGICVILNPAPGQALSDQTLKGLFCITPNETEVEIITGIKVNSVDEADQAATLLLNKGVQNVIVTMGASGSYFKSKNQCFFVKANKVTAIDTTAAGDVFNGALTVAIAANNEWKEAIEFATKAAGISVTKMGAQASAPKMDELE